MLLYPSLLLALLCLCGPDSFNISPKSGDNEWITSQVLGYIGRFHEYPTNGTDLIDYTNTSFDIYKNEYGDMINYIVPGPSIETQKRAFLNRKNHYDKESCTVYYKRKKYYFALSITEWQEDHFLWIDYFYKPAFFDKDGHYLFRLTDEIDIIFEQKLVRFVQKFPNQLRITVPDIWDQTKTVTPFLRVRVKYEKDGRVCLVEDYIIPKTAYILKDGDIIDVASIRVMVNNQSIDKMLQEYEPFFCKLTQEYPEIQTIDCLVPFVLIN